MPILLDLDDLVKHFNLKEVSFSMASSAEANAAKNCFAADTLSSAISKLTPLSLAKDCEVERGNVLAEATIDCVV